MSTVFTNGCFDVLHIGHIRLLKAAKSYGDRLIVGINSDESVRRLKGSSRPINVQAFRKEILEAFECVDEVIIFDEDTPCELISKIKPDIHVKGGDYDPMDYNSMPEAKIVHEYGGEVKIFNTIEGFSSSNIIGKLK